MSSKSHRAKALKSLIDAGPSTSSTPSIPASLVTSKASSVKAGVVGSALKGKGRVEEESEEEEEEEEDDEDVDMDAPIFKSRRHLDSDDDLLITPTPIDPRLQSSTLPTPVLPLSAPPSNLLPTSTTTSSSFAPLPSTATTALKSEFRRIPIPPHRMTPLKKEWVNVYGPLVEMMGLQVRMNVPRRCVELKTSQHTPDSGAIQKGADFLKAFSLGFDVNDALSILRLEDLYLDSFEIKDVKTLHGDHLSRAIGRIAGQDGKTRFVIENASRTRIVLADSHVHILGSVQNIKIARDAIVSLILGSPPGKVYAHLRTVGARLKQRF